MEQEKRKMAKLCTKIFANPILTLSLCFLLAKSPTVVAFYREHIGLHSSSSPFTISFPYTQEKRNSSLFLDSPTQIHFLATTSHLVSNKHTGPISSLWKQNNNIARIVIIFIWPLSCTRLCVGHFTYIISFNLTRIFWNG